MARHGIELASSVVRQLEGKFYVGRHITYSRAEAAGLVTQIQSAGVAARLITLPESEFGLANRYVVGVQSDDDMSDDERTMWQITAKEVNLPLLNELDKPTPEGVDGQKIEGEPEKREVHPVGGRRRKDGSDPVPKDPNAKHHKQKDKAEAQ